MTIILPVLLLAMFVHYGRTRAARRRSVAELPADYGMSPERPWERRPRRQVSGP